jgi:heme/copper-type cytochrome/quinol oxidase subunit 2
VTRLKLALVMLVIAVGVVFIAAWQWDAAMHKNNFGNASFNQGVVGQTLLGVVMIGIPAILFAVFSYLGLEWLLFRPGELADFRARRRIKAIGRELGEQSKPLNAPEAPRHDYAD